MISYKSLFDHNMKWEQLGEKLHNDAKTLQLLVLSNKNHQFKFKALIKSGSYILKSCKNNKLKYVDTKNCLLFRIYNDQNGDGIRIITGNFLLEFYGQVDEWFEELKLYCIQPNFSGNYQVGNLIGKGTYGKVYLAKSKTKSLEFAVKVFDKNNLKEQIEIDALIKEIEILRIVQHPRVIQLLETYESETHIFVVYELLKGGELKQMMKEKKLNQEQSISVIYKLIDALSYIHSKNIIHRDLKPENLIFRNLQNLEDIIIADFGLADFYRKDGQYLFTRCGTAGYLAPELIMNKPYDYKVDVYSLGIVFFMLLNGGQSPFENKDYNQQLQQNLQSNINLSKLGVRSDCQDLLSKMIDSNPQTRITSQQAKVHPLFHKQHQQVDLLTMKMNKPLSLQTVDFQKVQTIQSSRSNKHSYTFSNSLMGSPIVQKKISIKQNYSNTKVQGVDIKKQI